jgi:enterochelin esterase-like enzyme
MTRRRLLTAAVLTFVVLSAFASGAAVVVASRRSPAQAPAARTVAIVCRSPSLGGSLPADVYLPAGYMPNGHRYAVIYFLHGLPAGPTSYGDNAFVAGALAQAHEQAIVVAPQGARSNNSDREYLDWSAAENWPAAIAADLPACIDARFHTIADRYGRALMGLSAGGYGAFNVGLRNLAQFGAVESWSGYFEATDPSGDHVLEFGSAELNSAAAVPSGADLRIALRAWPTMIAFYVGRQDSRFLGMNDGYDAALRQSGISHIFRTYPGGHSTALWQTEAPMWLTWALDYLAAGQGHLGRPHE